MKTLKYATPAAFKAALEQRLRNASGSGAELARRRQLLVFDRFLARIARVFGDAATLKGGLVLEIRVERARTTKDVDLRLVGSPVDVLGQLQEAARLDLGEFMAFEVRVDAEHPEMQRPGQYDGLRYRAECRLAGKPYGHPFGVDVAFADPILGEPDVVVAEDLLDFAGIAPPKVRLYPIETHLAEKLHAYTLPRERPNSRIKDLPDLALLGTIRLLEARRIRKALEQTFGFRKTHPVPSSLPPPPTSWSPAYARMANEAELRWQTLDQVTAAARALLDPVLEGSQVQVWTPDLWMWSSR